MKCAKCGHSLEGNKRIYEGKKEYITVCLTCGHAESSQKEKTQAEKDVMDTIKECPLCLNKEGVTFEYGANWARINCVGCNLTVEQIRHYCESSNDMCDKLIKKWNRRYIKV